METIANGVWPTMITPFMEDYRIDYAALEDLVDWYITHGADGLFSVCQSSEMFFLSLEERVSLAEATVKFARGRVPVIASGHISSTIREQQEEMTAIAATGVDALVLVSNRLADQTESDTLWKERFGQLVSNLPEDISLGFYECPYPYKRLLSLDVLDWLDQTGRVSFIKDTCCDVPTIQSRAKIAAGGNLKLFNANSASLLISLQAGYSGFCGVMANFQMEQYAYLVQNWQNGTEKIDLLSDYLGVSSIFEARGYPLNAKHYLRREGIAIQSVSKVSKRVLSNTELLELEQFKRLNSYFFDLWCKD